MLNVTIQTDREADRTSRNPSYHLYLNFVQNNNRLSTVKEISKQLNISLQNAKSTVDSAADGRKVLLTQSFEKNASAKLLKIKTTKNGCKIVRKAGKSKSWPTDCDSHNNNVIVIDFKVSCTAKSCN